LLSIVFGLLSAISWGAGDFTGGLAARKVGAVRAVFYASVIGLIAVTISAWAANEAVPSLRVWLIAMLAGIFGSTGLILLYAAMANGTMSIAAPVSALLAAALPVLVGTLTEGLPETLTLIGFGFALFAVWMVSQSEGGVKDILSHLADLKLPLLAGLGFGGYFIVMHRATDEGALLWAMTGSRSSSVLLIFIYMLVTRTSFRVDDRSSFPVIGVNGVLDLTGNAFFILAAQAGRLDVASVLSSLYPGSTVMLAWIFLHERLSRTQWIGILSALIAIVLMTL
jgi:drug/metabolite transporter (DMT)-like permease